MGNSESSSSRSGDHSSSKTGGGSSSKSNVGDGKTTVEKSGNIFASTETKTVTHDDGSKTVVETNKVLGGIGKETTTTKYDCEGNKTEKHYETNQDVESWTKYHSDGSKTEVVDTESTASIWETNKDGEKKLTDIVSKTTVSDIMEKAQ